MLFRSTRWTGFNPLTYGLGYPFPYAADNTQAICRRPSNGDVVFNPTYHGIHAWNGSQFFPLEDQGTTSQGFAEDSQGRLWNLGEYGGLRFYDESSHQWINQDLTGWGNRIIRDPGLTGYVWAATDYQILRTDGTNAFSRTIEDFPGSAAWFTGFAADQNGIAWVGTWSQFTSTGSTLIRIDANTGQYQTWSHDEGWPFPGEHVRPMAITPDGRLWMMYDSEYPSIEAGLCWYDGVNVGSVPASPGGVPQWGGMPNSNIRTLEVRETEDGYELWMSCMGRGMAVLTVITDPVSVTETFIQDPENRLSLYPNPAVEQVSFGFNNDQYGFVSLSVYDINGQKVKEVISKSLDKGHHTAEWDLTDLNGNRIKSGVYLAKLVNSNRASTAKMMVY